MIKLDKPLDDQEWVPWYGDGRITGIYQIIRTEKTIQYLPVSTSSEEFFKYVLKLKNEQHKQ